jgi:hypothetical protein
MTINAELLEVLKGAYESGSLRGEYVEKARHAINNALRESSVQAFNLGYKHGYEDGNERNPYDGEKQGQERLSYRLGYEQGVAAYCRDAHPEDEEVCETSPSDEA